ncbi:uncharacterized protein LOC116143919 [Pistacia vera]|uniref:uncharacterized protein LOC116143919 n=1 Tax=Pistacia vera TaxID=55513 RepID=UPI001262BAFD|nr:uncharacterized protein LOC116143919 [Pistacia vera]
MALALKFLTLSSLCFPPSTTSLFLLRSNYSQSLKLNNKPSSIYTVNSKFFHLFYRFSVDDENDDENSNSSVDEAVALFNKRAYYECHDSLEALWYSAEEPTRTLIHDSKARALHLKNLLQTTSKGNLSIADYVKKMKEIAESLSASGLVVSSEDLLQYVLDGLGPEFDAVVLTCTIAQPI